MKNASFRFLLRWLQVLLDSLPIDGLLFQISSTVYGAGSAMICSECSDAIENLTAMFVENRVTQRNNWLIKRSQDGMKCKRTKADNDTWANDFYLLSQES